MMEKGCDWMGSPDQLEDHLDPNLDNCQYIDIKCPQNCQQIVPRNKLEHHMKMECDKRVFKCRYCPFTGNYKEMSEFHMSACRYAPPLNVSDISFYATSTETNTDNNILHKTISQHMKEIQKTVNETSQEEGENFMQLNSSLIDEESKYDVNESVSIEMELDKMKNSVGEQLQSAKDKNDEGQKSIMAELDKEEGIKSVMVETDKEEGLKSVMVETDREEGLKSVMVETDREEGLKSVMVETDKEEGLKTVMVETDREEGLKSVMVETDKEERLTSVMVETDKEERLTSVMVETDKEEGLKSVMVETDEEGLKSVMVETDKKERLTSVMVETDKEEGMKSVMKEELKSVKEEPDLVEQRNVGGENTMSGEIHKGKDILTDHSKKAASKEFKANLARKLKPTLENKIIEKHKMTWNVFPQTKQEKKETEQDTSTKFAEQKDLKEVESKLRKELRMECDKVTKEHELKIREVEKQLEEHKKKIESQRRSIGETESRIMEHLSRLEKPSDITEADAREKLADRELLQAVKKNLEEQDKKILEQEEKLTEQGTNVEKQNELLKKLRTTSLSVDHTSDKEPHEKNLERQMESLEKELKDNFKELEQKYFEVSSSPVDVVTSTDLSNILFGMRRTFEMKEYTGTQAGISPVMYTHLCGYKFCISIGSFLTGDLFVEAIAMPGEFDEQLKWPITAEFSLRLVNCRGGEDITSTTPPYSWDRPKISKVRLGYFKRVSPNTFLQHCDVKDYLLNGTLQFIITKVKLL